MFHVGPEDPSSFKSEASPSMIKEVITEFELVTTEMNWEKYMGNKVYSIPKHKLLIKNRYK